MARPMKSRRYRVGLLGTDHWYWATGLVKQLQTSPRYEFAAIWEPQAWRLKALKPGAGRVASRPEEITDDPAIDVVISLLPCPANARWIARAAAHGKAIVSNKPMAMTVAQATPIVAALNRSRRPSYTLEGGAPLGVRPRFVRAVLRQGSLGRPLTGEQRMRGGMPKAWWDAKGSGRKAWGWWTDPRLVPGGAWIDHSIYALAEFRFLLDDAPVAVNAMMANLKHARGTLGLEDYGIASYRYAKGPVVTMEDDWVGGMGSGGALVCERGSLRWGFGIPADRIEMRTAKGVKLQPLPAWKAETPLAHLARCLDEGRETLAPAALGLENLRLALAAYRAARTGRSVRV